MALKASGRSTGKDAAISNDTDALGITSVSNRIEFVWMRGRVKAFVERKAGGVVVVEGSPGLGKGTLIRSVVLGWLPYAFDISESADPEEKLLSDSAEEPIVVCSIARSHAKVMMHHSSSIVRKLYPWQKPFQFILDELSREVVERTRRLKGKGRGSSASSIHSEVELSRKEDGTVVSKPRHRDNVSRAQVPVLFSCPFLTQLVSAFCTTHTLYDTIPYNIKTKP